MKMHMLKEVHLRITDIPKAMSHIPRLIPRERTRNPV